MHSYGPIQLILKDPLQFDSKCFWIKVLDSKEYLILFVLLQRGLSTEYMMNVCRKKILPAKISFFYSRWILRGGVIIREVHVRAYSEMFQAQSLNFYEWLLILECDASSFIIRARTIRKLMTHYALLHHRCFICVSLCTSCSRQM